MKEWIKFAVTSRGKRDCNAVRRHEDTNEWKTGYGMSSRIQSIDTEKAFLGEAGISL